MAIVMNRAGNDVVHTDPFGPVPTTQTDGAAELRRLQSIAGRLFDKCISIPVTDETLKTELNDFRTGVGALWVQLKQQVEHDTEEAYKVTRSLWKCVLFSMFTKRLHPLKYYDLCGKPGVGYGGLVTQLANLPTGGTPWRAAVKNWGAVSWQEHVDRVWKTKGLLMEKEAEYRAAANVVLQVGIGWGGMLLGLVGLLAGVIIPILTIGH